MDDRTSEVRRVHSRAAMFIVAIAALSLIALGAVNIVASWDGFRQDAAAQQLAHRSRDLSATLFSILAAGYLISCPLQLALLRRGKPR